jgi:peroxiredoxin
MAISKQWVAVGTIVAGLSVGAVALVTLGPRIERVEVGARAPNFQAVNLATNDPISLREEYRGSVTLVNIWATWCGPCVEEMPAIQGLYRALGPRGFRVAAVSIDEGDPADVRAFARNLGITFDLLQDRSGLIQRTYQTTGVPESFLLDRDGVIVKRIIGAHDWGSPVNRRLVERLVAAGGR